MRNRKGILTIILLTALLFFVPTNTKAYNSAPAFKCFYTTKVTEGNTNVTYTLKLLYVDGELEAAKYKTSQAGYNEVQLTPKEVEKFGTSLWNQIGKVGGECPSSIMMDRHYLQVKMDYNSKVPKTIVKKKNDGQTHTYNITSAKTQFIANVSDKDCSYTNKDKSPSSIDVHFYRTKYYSSYIKNPQTKMTGFWLTKKHFLYNSSIATLSPAQIDGIYSSLYDYITKYSSNPQKCPEKIFYNSSGKWYAATDAISDRQNQDTTDFLSGDDGKYSVYKIDNKKVCKDNLAANQSIATSAESLINQTESSVKNTGELNYDIGNNLVTQFESAISKMKELDDSIKGCIGVEGYENLEAKAKDLAEKLKTIRKDLKAKIRSSNIDDEQKTELLKRIDRAYNKLQKMGSLDLSQYNQPQNCETIFGDPNQTDTLAYLIQKILNYIKVIGPILVVVLSSLDFIKIILTSDDENMKKAQIKLGKRLIAALLLFLLPVLVSLIFNVINNSTIDPTCGIH